MASKVLKSKTKKNPDSNKPKSDAWHRKIAENRGESWRKNVMAGRRDAILNPSTLRLLRISKNIMQSAMARQLQMSESAYGAVERGRQKVREPKAKQIAGLLQVPVTKIFKVAGEKKMIAIVQKQVL